MDRFALIIYKQRLLLYPEGQSLNGLKWQVGQSVELQVGYS